MQCVKYMKVSVLGKTFSIFVGQSEDTAKRIPYTFRVDTDNKTISIEQDENEQNVFTFKFDTSLRHGYECTIGIPCDIIAHAIPYAYELHFESFIKIHNERLEHPVANNMIHEFIRKLFTFYSQHGCVLMQHHQKLRGDTCHCCLCEERLNDCWIMKSEMPKGSLLDEESPVDEIKDDDDESEWDPCVVEARKTPCGHPMAKKEPINDYVPDEQLEEKAELVKSKSRYICSCKHNSAMFEIHADDKFGEIMCVGSVPLETDGLITLILHPTCMASIRYDADFSKLDQEILGVLEEAFPHGPDVKIECLEDFTDHYMLSFVAKLIIRWYHFKKWNP